MLINKLIKQYVRLCFFSITVLTCLFIVNAQEQQNKSEKNQADQKLDQVQQAISAQKNTIKKVNRTRRSLEEQLKADDLAIAAVAKKITSINKQQKSTKKTLKSLAIKKTTLTIAKQKQEKVLAQQLRAAYSTGHHDYLKLVLNQEDPASVQRTVTYYQYLNNARIEQIEKFQTTLSELLAITKQHIEQAEKLTLLEKQHANEKKAFVQNKKQRAKTMLALNKDLKSKQQQLDNLIAQEENLVAALARLSSLTQQESNLSGLKDLKQKLSWPVSGKINHSFGSRKQGYLKWKGVLMKAPVGKQVKTIHNGTVLFSDWLKGYGLVTVIDHGEGYMSLYGHNQALLKTVGERVETGEPIALVGQSGGQTQAGLYFEIRHRGKAVNPKLWCN